MSRTDALFSKKQKNILSIYFTAGFPRVDSTKHVARALQQAGADMMEIGIPFSDPVADGEVIQQCNQRALENGITLKKILEQIQSFRNDITLPIVVMSYLNPIFQYGVEKFCADAAAAGVDGVIVPDMPLHEFEWEYKAYFDKYKLSVSLLISPNTSDERMAKIDSLTTGFIYAVSSSATTGKQKNFSDEQRQYFEKIKNKKLKHPLLMGFGIHDKQTFETACHYFSGGIIGSAFMRCVAQATDVEKDIDTFVKSFSS